MMKYIAILRGVNVSGKNIIKMAALRNVLSEAGFKNVKSYIQSGNLIFEYENADPLSMAEKIRHLILKAFGIDTTVIVKSGDDFSKTYHNNPFLKKSGLDNSKLHITFLEKLPSKERIDQIIEISDTPNEMIPGMQALYLHTPNGYSKCKFTNSFLESKLKVSATTRNLKTVGRLLAMQNEED